MKVLLDTNVFLDVLLMRQAFVEDSAWVLDWCGSNHGRSWISWHSFSNLYYVGCKALGKRQVLQHLNIILGICNLAPVYPESASVAIKMGMPDLEDAMQVACALPLHCDGIITRNLKDFPNSPIRAISPAQFRSFLTE